MRAVSIVCVAVISLLASSCAKQSDKEVAAVDPLPSWNEGDTKTAIIAFVDGVTDEDSEDFVPVHDRVAVFDNDGTLWCEKPTVQAAFALERLRAMLPEHPDWQDRQPYKAALEGDTHYLKEAGMSAIMELLAASHTGVTQREFRKMVTGFFATAEHPDLGVPYTKVGYLPMRELLDHLRANDFEVYICSGGGIYFMRIVAEEMYGVPPENVIGSSPVLVFRETRNVTQLDRTAELNSFNDREVKAANIELHIGRVPIFAAGNVRSGGDIAMLRYCQSNHRPNFQLLIDHDDAKREYSYAEASSASINAALQNGWTVVSIARDWEKVFAFEPGASGE